MCLFAVQNWKNQIFRRPSEHPSGEILKRVHDGHFTIPWGLGRGFMKGKEESHMTKVVSPSFRMSSLGRDRTHSQSTTGESRHPSTTKTRSRDTHDDPWTETLKSLKQPCFTIWLTSEIIIYLHADVPSIECNS